MAEQCHKSIINSSNRFALEKMGLSVEWYYLSQQQLTTNYFILLGCYQLGGNFISWKAAVWQSSNCALWRSQHVSSQLAGRCAPAGERCCASRACVGCPVLLGCLVLPCICTAVAKKQSIILVPARSSS